MFARIAAALTLLLASACASTSGPIMTPRPPTTSVPAAPSGLPSSKAGRPAATVAQYASAVSRSASGIRDYGAELDNCMADWTTAACTLNAYGAGLAAELLQLTLGGLADPSKKTYIGPPPAEIDHLVRDTLDDAANLMKLGKAYTPGGDFLRVDFAVGTLVEDLAAWSPYGVG